jgi:hypothetical protein
MIHAALIPRLVAEDARSLALGGSSPIDAYYQLRRYLTHHRAPDVLIASYSPRHLGDRHFPLFWKRSVRYGAHTHAEFVEILARSKQLDVELLPGHSAGRAHLEWWLYRTKFPPYYLAAIKNSNHVERRALNAQMKRKVTESGGHVLYGTAAGPHPPAFETELRSFRVEALRDSYLRDLFDLAARNGIRVIFAASAFSETSLRAMDEGFERDYWRYVAELGRDHPTVLIEEGFRPLPDDYFGDSTHVNESGARAFSAQIARVVTQLRRGGESHAQVQPRRFSRTLRDR